AVVPDLADDLKARLQKAAVDACQALLVRDYARVDLRMSETQEVYVIEVNANCDLAKTSEFATGAQAFGLDYRALVNRIAELALERRRPAPVPRTRRAKKAAAQS